MSFVHGFLSPDDFFSKSNFTNNSRLFVCLFVCLFCCFTSQVNSYGHGGTVSSPNHTLSWASLNKQLTSTSSTYFRLLLVKILPEYQTVWIKIRPDVFVGPDLGPNCLQKLSAEDTCSQRANSNSESVLHISARLYTCMYIVTYVCYIM